MQPADVIRKCREILAEAGFEAEGRLSSPERFLDDADTVRDVVKEWPRERLEDARTLEFAESLRRLRDSFLDEVEADPMIIYQPAHKAALEFHSSPAKIRYFRAPNRSSKTQSAVADNYWVLTGQHPYRRTSPLPAAVGVVGLNFSKLMSGVYAPKYLNGEVGNPLSPAFPEGGKWFNRWQEREKILTVACPECANAGKAGSCKHTQRSTLRFYSAESGPGEFQGNQLSQWHFDEQIVYGFFPEGMERIKNVPNSSGIVTETPLGGKGFWTHTVLTRDATNEYRDPITGRLLVSLHTCTQYETGLSPEEEIRATERLYSKEEAEARIYGRPAAFSKTAVFDNHEVSAMLEQAEEPALRGDLLLARTTESEPEVVEDGRNTSSLLTQQAWADNSNIVIICREHPEAMLRVWEEPEEGAQYVIGADVSQGLTNKDASCAQVIRMRRNGLDLHLDQVASMHGWINSYAYGFDLYKLSLWYNHATLVPERRGPGDATIQCLVDHFCTMLYQDRLDPALAELSPDPRFGLDTNVKTKGLFISVLQQAIKDRRTGRRILNIRDRSTLEELGSYGQELTASGLSYRFRGEAGMPDDRVMGLALAVYAALNLDLYSMSAEREAAQKQAEQHLNTHDREFWREVREEEAHG